MDLSFSDSGLGVAAPAMMVETFIGYNPIHVLLKPLAMPTEADFSAAHRSGYRFQLFRQPLLAIRTSAPLWLHLSGNHPLNSLYFFSSPPLFVSIAVAARSSRDAEQTHLLISNESAN
jgi:hypothetical protein